ncbi:MAG: hypothetical protein ABI651_04380 [Verrucomicrobiota bacterium]
MYKFAVKKLPKFFQFGQPTQWRPGEGADRGALATGDDHDVEMDSPTIALGKLDECFQLFGETQK